MLKNLWHLIFPKSYKHVYQAKQKILNGYRNYKLPKTSLTQEEKLRILESSVTQLKQKLINEEITSKEILITYAERALTIGIDQCYVTDFDLDYALARAEECDRILKSTPKKDRENLGLLFGIPVSIKENIIQKGFDSTCGTATRCFNPSLVDSATVQLIRKAGAIPFVRTNVPQLLSVIETVNFIWGRANNPWDPTRSTGGSSGGEAGMITTGCSPLGFGTDGLSSLRTPASWCGIYSFKPTTGRVSWRRSTVHFDYLAEGKWGIMNANIGPMAKSAYDLELCMKCLIHEDNRQTDPKFPYLPWNDQLASPENKKFKIGYFTTEDMFGACKTARRAVMEAVEEMRKQGHEVEEIKIPRFNEIIRVAIAIMTSDGKGRANMSALNGETLINEMRYRLMLYFIPNLIRKLITPLLKLFGEERALFFSDVSNGLSGHQFLYIINEKEELEKEFFDYFHKKKLDVIICPATGLPALLHGTSGELALNVCYSWIGNVLNLPSGMLPVTRVKEGEDHYSEEDCRHRDILFRLSKKNMKGSIGLPVGVQVLSLPWEDEKCIAVMKILEERFPSMLKLS